MGVPNLEVGYTSATTGSGDDEVHKEHVVALGERQVSYQLFIFNYTTDIISTAQG
jgi:hypothetical protein